MSNLIKREDAIKAVLQKPAIHGCDGSWYHADDIKDALESVPSADRPQGEWKHDGSVWTYRFNCTNCGYHLLGKQTNYCPNCGAKMKGADDE